MKKIALLLAVLMLVLSIAACADTGSNNKDSGKDNTTTAATTAPTTPGVTPTNPSTPNTPSIPDGPAISDNWSDFEFVLDGAKYRLPCTVQSFQSNGWSFQTDVSADSLEYDDSDCFTIVKGNMEVDLWIYNLTNDAIAVTDGTVCRIDVDSGVPMRIAKNITFGSSATDVTNAFGFPDSYHYMDLFDETENYQYWEMGGNYSLGNYVSVSCTKTNGVYLVDTIELTCYEDFASVPVKVDTTAPSYLSTYQAPTALGTNPATGIVQIAGDLYQLPCPVSAFLNKGWVVTDHDGPMDSQDTGLLYVSRNGVELALWIGNMGSTTVIPQNAAVYCITVDTEDYEVYGNCGITLPGQITIGSTNEDVLAVLNPLEETFYTENDGTYIYYSYEIYDYGFMVSIQVDIATNTVCKLAVQNETWIYG